MTIRFLLILSLFFTSAFSQSLTEEVLLNHGLELEAEGQYEQALEIWSSAFTELDSPSLAIGREYIRLVTEHNLNEYFELASSMYLWGLTAEMLEPNREALEQELYMLRPLAEQNTGRKWDKLFENNDPALYRELYSFWQELNPTPGTRYNERLIEHWERIAFAREHYNRRSDPPYGTDDRGVVYIQYGAPSRVQSGNLRLARGEVFTECGYLSGCNPNLMADVVMGLDTNPYYEIWIYERPSQNMEYNLIMIFGERPLDGFRRVNVLEDFIPRRAFSLNDERYAFQSLTG